MSLTVFIIPAVICAVFVTALIKKVDIMKEFSFGARDGLKTSVTLFPTLTIMMTAIGMLRASGALDSMTSVLAPLLGRAELPKEVIPLMLLKPFSGSGSIAIIDDIFSRFSPDSYAGRIASVIAGSTETTFYTVAVYFGAVGVTKTRHAIPCAVTADIVGFFLSVIFVKLFFYS